MEFIENLINPIVRKIETELNFLTNGNLTWRFYKKDFEYIGEIRSYVPYEYQLFLDDLIRQHTHIGLCVSEHDATLKEAREKANEISKMLASDEEFVYQVENELKNWEKTKNEKIISAVTPKQLPELIAQYLINEIVNLIQGNDTYWEFWRDQRRQFLGFLNNLTAFNDLSKIKQRLSNIDEKLISLLNDLRFSLVKLSLTTTSSVAELKAEKSLLELWANADTGTFAVVFTDVIGSTSLTNKLGNHRWNDVRELHFKRARTAIGTYRGLEIKTLGDGFLCLFRTASDGLRFCLDLHQDTGSPFIEMRASMHVGSVIIQNADVVGNAVNYAQRVGSHASGAEIWLSDRAKKDIDEEGFDWPMIVAWQDHPEIELKGLDGKDLLWRVYTSWPEDKAPNFPSEMLSFVKARLPGYKLPEAKDIQGEWKNYANPTTLYPFYCSGDFFGDGTLSHAFFVLNEKASKYQVVIMHSPAEGALTVYSSEGTPYNLFISKVGPGEYESLESRQKQADKKLILRHDAINMGQFEVSDWIYAWNAEMKVFEETWMSD